MFIPKWFRKEVKKLDPELQIVADEELGIYTFWKTLDIYYPGPKGKLRHSVEVVCRAVFSELNEKALENLRYRQWLGRKFMGKPGMAYWKWIKDQDRENKMKIEEEAVEQIAEGFRKIDNLRNKRKVMYT